MQRVVFGLIVCVLLAGQGLFSIALAQNKEAASKKEKTQEIIAEGVGATADEAIKDAYRNAVRQVVGAVVDAETLVKNDEVIDDKVLTYSDGFIKGYEEVNGSKKVKSGLHRIKIKAQVERRSVIAKLKAANVTVKEVDGKGLFAEAVTQLDAEKDAAALLKKQFEGFPQSCITATIIGKPEIVDKSADKATMKLDVQFELDLKAYKAFAEKLVPILDNIATDRGDFTAKFSKWPHREKDADVHMVTDEPSHPGLHALTKKWMPKSNYNGFLQEGNPLTFAVATSHAKAADRLDYKYFVLDPSLQDVLKSIAARSCGSCKLSLLDGEGETIATDRFEAEKVWNGKVSFAAAPICIVGTNAKIGPEWKRPYARASIVFLSPMFLACGDYACRTTTLTLPRSLTLSLDELKSVKDAKVEITFDE